MAIEFTSSFTRAINRIVLLTDDDRWLVFIRSDAHPILPCDFQHAQAPLQILVEGKVVRCCLGGGGTHYARDVGSGGVGGWGDPAAVKRLTTLCALHANKNYTDPLNCLSPSRSEEEGLSGLLLLSLKYTRSPEI